MESLHSLRLSIAGHTYRELDRLSQIGDLWRSPDYTDQLKFIAESIIAFKGREDAASLKVLALAKGLICSTDTRCAIAVQPSIAGYFFGAYVQLPTQLKEPGWDGVFAAAAAQFPPVEADLPKYRIEEQAYTEVLAAGASPAGLELDLDEFVRNAASLSRDQMYAFTHRLFYLTNYCQSAFAGDTAYLAEHVRLQAFYCYVDNDIDVFLEYVLCYMSLRDCRRQEVGFLLVLLWRMLLRDRNRSKLILDPASFDFRAYYHQAFLFVMAAGHANFAWDEESFSLDSYRLYRSRYRFLQKLRGLDIVDVYQIYASTIRPGDGGYYSFLLKRFARSVRLSGVLEEELSALPCAANAGPAAAAPPAAAAGR